MLGLPVQGGGTGVPGLVLGRTEGFQILYNCPMYLLKLVTLGLVGLVGFVGFVGYVGFVGFVGFAGFGLHILGF